MKIERKKVYICFLYFKRELYSFYLFLGNIFLYLKVKRGYKKVNRVY